MADELNVDVLTLRKWDESLRRCERGLNSGHARLPQDGSPEERLMALQNDHSHRPVDEATNGRCRERGPLTHHLAQRYATFCSAGAAASRREIAQEVRDLKQANVQLQRELKCKEQALAEAARYRTFRINERRFMRSHGGAIHCDGKPASATVCARVLCIRDPIEDNQGVVLQRREQEEKAV